ncbi:MAG TPA: hypothetical protein VFZ53_27170, partial [Polyangiaceae bacterium]
MSALVLVACSGKTPASTVPETPVRSNPTRPVDDARAAERHVWATSTRSPQPFDARTGDGSPCGRSDRALERVAERIVLREAAGKRPLDTSELTFALRSEGAPYVWPRAWTLEGPFGVEVERAKLTEWLATLGDH